MTQGTAADEALHHRVEMRLAAANQRYTGGRRMLIDALHAAPRPLDMRALLQACEPSDGRLVAQSSAYRNLSVLTAAGVVRRIAGSDDAGHYELDEALVGGHHHHAVCLQCGKVADIDSSARLERALSDAASIASEQSGFVLDSHRIDLVGLCRDCA